MATLEFDFLQGQLEERKRRLEVAIASAPHNSGLGVLLREVDSALDRMAEGTYGLCLECHDSVETGPFAGGSIGAVLSGPSDPTEREPRCSETSTWLPRCSATCCRKKACAWAAGRRAIISRRSAPSAATTAT